MDIEPADAIREGLTRTFREPAPAVSLPQELRAARDHAEVKAIGAALAAAGRHRDGSPNKAHAAALLGISRVTLYKIMRRHGID
jgi:transcriptional regulator of acetoin/glycerol metabolism